MKDILQLGKLLAEEVVNDPGICFYPGAFKPPHKGHFEVANNLASRNYITGVSIIISPKERDGITAQQSLDIWNMYLEASPNGSIRVRKATTESPIKDIYKYIAEHPLQSPIYIAGSVDEIDDQDYFESLKKAFGDRVIALPVVEKADSISASVVRDYLRAGNYDKFESALPTAAVDKGYAPRIFRNLTSTITNRELKEHQEPQQSTSLESALDKFTKWCCKTLGIDQEPDVELIYDPEYSSTQCSFGGYNPNTKSISIVVVNRNLADIQRTLAHELVHCKQDIQGAIQAESGETGSEIENEANAVAGIIMREYGKRNPEIYQTLVPNTLTPLNEVVKDPYKWTLTGMDEEGNIFYTFSTPNHEYTVGIADHGDDSYELNFNTSEGSKLDTEEGVAIRILAVIVNIAKDFITRMDPQELIIRPIQTKGDDDLRRFKIYGEYLRKYLPQNYGILTVGETYRIIKK